MKILFVCTGNTCRSPMAEAMFKQTAKTRHLKVDAASCGIYAEAGSPVSKNSNVALRKLGFKGTRHKSKNIGDINLKSFDLIVTLSSHHKQSLTGLNNVISFDELIGFDIVDPYMQGEQVYVDCAKQILVGVNKLVDILSERIKKGNK